MKLQIKRRLSLLSLSVFILGQSAQAEAASFADLAKNYSAVSLGCDTPASSLENEINELLINETPNHGALSTQGFHQGIEFFKRLPSERSTHLSKIREAIKAEKCSGASSADLKKLESCRKLAEANLLAHLLETMGRNPKNAALKAEGEKVLRSYFRDEQHSSLLVSDVIFKLSLLERATQDGLVKGPKLKEVKELRAQALGFYKQKAKSRPGTCAAIQENTSFAETKSTEIQKLFR